MSHSSGMDPEKIAVRAHDIVVSLERHSVPEFDLISILGKAVRLALHLRGVQAVSYDVIRGVAVYLLDFPSDAVRLVLEFLAEAEFVRLDTQGKTIKTVIPDVPYYEDLFFELGEMVSVSQLSEPEQLTLSLVQRLSDSPLLIDHAYDLGAEKKLVDRVVDIGSEGAFFVNRRARGRNVLVSPTYFSENQDAYADLVAAKGAARVRKVLGLLKSNQGWPLSKIEAEQEIGGTRLDEQDLAVIRMLAGDGFVAPPGIETKHAGLNHFMFGPRPGEARLPALKRHVYEAAMALVAAVRQGQFLPAEYAIHSPEALLRAFRDRGYIRTSGGI